jgi:hypothetical protein
MIPAVTKKSVWSSWGAPIKTAKAIGATPPPVAPSASKYKAGASMTPSPSESNHSPVEKLIVAI